LTTKLNRKGIWQRHGLLVFVAARHERPDGGRVPAAAAPADLPPARLRVYEVSATGGSEANLTAVLAALAARFPGHPEEGLAGAYSGRGLPLRVWR